jgi:hypothetical protein
MLVSIKFSLLFLFLDTSFFSFFVQLTVFDFDECDDEFLGFIVSSRKNLNNCRYS